LFSQSNNITETRFSLTLPSIKKQEAKMITSTSNPFASLPLQMVSSSRVGIFKKRHVDLKNMVAKPKKALSAYNLFYTLERKRILAGTDTLGLPVTVEELVRARREHKTKPKRLHRKTHGKIGFMELNRRIGKRWKKLTASEKAIFQEQALLETKDYDNKFQEWRAYDEAQAATRGVVQIQTKTQACVVHQVNRDMLLTGRKGLETLEQTRNRVDDEISHLSNPEGGEHNITECSALISSWAASSSLLNQPEEYLHRLRPGFDLFEPLDTREMEALFD
jgi:hypothetical protein